MRGRARRSCHDGIVRIEPARLAGVVTLNPHPHYDDRGLFTRTFDADIFDQWCGVPGAAASFVQDSQSRSVRGVIRGMHGRRGEGEAKLVRCAHGAVHDVLVDARPQSPTFGEHEVFLLDDATFKHLYVPPGMLHGFQALTDVADVCYRIDRPHDPADDLAVAHDDPDLGIDWPLRPTLLSPRDAAAGTWAELVTQLR
jgi:dTDP-4-dehydrorhamnose 3,5-epimerase